MNALGESFEIRVPLREAALERAIVGVNELVEQFAKTLVERVRHEVRFAFAEP